MMTATILVVLASRDVVVFRKFIVLILTSRRPEQLDLRRVAHVSCIGESEVRLQRMGLIKNLQRV